LALVDSTKRNASELFVPVIQPCLTLWIVHTRNVHIVIIIINQNNRSIIITKHICCNI